MAAEARLAAARRLSGSALIRSIVVMPVEGKLGAMIMPAGLSDDEIVIMPVDVVMPVDVSPDCEGPKHQRILCS
jgi:hypothetical protein